MNAARQAADRGSYHDAVKFILLARERREDSPAAGEERAAILSDVSAMVDLLSEGSGRRDRQGPLRVLVTGIGRSGTTLIYQQIAKSFLRSCERANFRYEPYLWNVRSPAAVGNAFDVAQLHHYGMDVHTRVPLFLDGSDSLHDAFLDELFDAPWDRDPAQLPDAFLTKVIRGGGRLRSYLKRFEDLRIVVCLRNPLDTINSSLAMFSFLGEEFHADDRPRMAAELTARGQPAPSLDIPPRAIEWPLCWWRAFHDNMCAVAREHPDRVLLFCYEEFQAAPRATLEQVRTFLGLEGPEIHFGLNRPAGPSMKRTSLTRHDIARVHEELERYAEDIMLPRLGRLATDQSKDSLLRRFIGGKFTIPVAGMALSRKSSIQLRGIALSGKVPAWQLNPPQNPVKPRLARHIAAISDNAPLAPARLRAGGTFGVVITCHNNGDTIMDAVLSCLDQRLPFDRIVVVDDNSSDQSTHLLRELADLYSSVRLIALRANVGPAAARDLGIRALDTDFVTQLDGDDLFLPDKLAAEAEAIDGDRRVIAFSDILMVTPDSEFLHDTKAYDGLSGPEAHAILLRRQSWIPRDLTMAREIYLQSGGYDYAKRLYEDWDLKLRLARGCATWRRSTTIAGTAYNRLSPGLSGADGSAHARALSTIFYEHAHRYAAAGERLAAYDAALGRFREYPVAVAARACLDLPADERAAVAVFMRSRRAHAMPNPAFRASLASIGGQNQEKIEAVCS